MQKALSRALGAIVVLATVLLTTVLSMPAISQVKTLSNNTLKDKGYDRLEGTNQFKLGCRHLVRSEDRSITFRPTSSSGMAIGWTIGNIFYSVLVDDKTTMHGSDGSTLAVTTWRTCVVL